MTVQLGLFPGFTVDVLPEPPPPEPESPPPELPEPPLPGQIGLFEWLGIYLGKMQALASEGRFPEALARARELAERLVEAEPWEALLATVVDEVAATGTDAARLASLASRWSSEAAIPSLRDAIVRGLHRRTAEASERESAGAIIDGRPAGWHWMQADCFDQAERSLLATAARGELVGRALVFAGNAALRSGRNQAARGHYGRALLLVPDATPLNEVEDNGIRDLIAEARDLELEPAEAWAPVVGELNGVLPVCREQSANAAVARFHALLAQSRAATAQRTQDVAARRELKQLAPMLFEQLRDSGRL